MLRPIVFLLLLMGIWNNVCSQEQSPLYKNPRYSNAERVEDLLKRMTQREKFWQLFMIPGDLGEDPDLYKEGLFGFQVSAANAGNNAGNQMLQYNTKEDALSLAKKVNQIQSYFVHQTRLGIPIIPFDEALHGLVRNGATAFPQSIALAATFDTATMGAVSRAIAIESKVRGIRDILSPVLNIASDVRWGRTEETYGEDPLLVTQMAGTYIRNLEQNGIVATPKHFIANVGDGGRDSYPIHASELLLDELYFPPFKYAVQQAGARSIMTAYNSVNGIPATANDWLLNKKLKQDWGFKGFVISDAGAVGGSTVLHHTTADYPASSADAINNGLDVIFQTQYKHHELFMPPFLDGSISKERIDDAVRRVLRIKFELGLFDQPFVDENEAAKWVNNSVHKKLAREAAAKSFVLLKNSQEVLPIQPAVRTIAVIGEEAVKGRLGGYSGPGNGVATILDGIKAAAGKNRKLIYSKGASVQSDLFSVIPSENLYTDNSGSTRGLMANYFNGLEPGKSLVKIKKVNELNESYTFMSPDSTLDANHFSVRYTGYLVPDKTGKYQLALEGNDGFRMYLDNRLIINQWSKLSYRRSIVSLLLEKGKQYAIRVEFYESKGNAKIKLLWNRAVTDSTDRLIADAVAVARQSDLALVVAGIHEGEFQDRARLSLTSNQEKLIEAIAATGKPVVVMLTGGSAITMEKWLNKVNGVIMLWYPGEEGGNAVGDILFGKKNPAGRLPITFPISEGQVPLVYNHKPTGRGDDYHDLSGEPLFPFGYGLSYTDFQYSNLRFSNDSLSETGEINIFVDVQNTGKKEGEEVVQLYVNDFLSSVATPVQSLADFKRIHLVPREKKTVVFSLSSKLFYLINKERNAVFEPGLINIMIGKNSKELLLKKKLMLWKSE